MQTGSQDQNVGSGSGFAMTASADPSRNGATDLNASRHSSEGNRVDGGVAGRPDARRQSSAFLGLRVAMPLALLLWGLVITALWSMLR